MKQSGPKPAQGVPCCGSVKEDDQSFRYKLRSDMIQVVRDQHQLLQDWACQWESRSQQQLDEHMQELRTLIDELRKEVHESNPRRKATPSGGLKSLYASKLGDLDAYGDRALNDERSLVAVPVSMEQKAGASPASPAKKDKDQDDKEKGKPRPIFDKSVSVAAEVDNKRQYPSWIDDGTYGLSKWPTLLSLLNMAMTLAQSQEPERNGPLARVIKNTKFESMCMLVIVLNTITIFFSTNYAITHLTDGGTSVTKLFDVLFTVFYVVELMLKLMVHRFYFFVNEDKFWNLFDLSLVSIGALEMITWAADGGEVMNPVFMRLIRLLKLAKILRVVRVMRFFRELRLMLKCVVGSFVSLFWACVMLMCFNLLFGIFFVQQFTNYLIEQADTIAPASQDQILDSWGSVGMAMLSLFKAISGGNDWDLYYKVVQQTGWGNSTVFIFYILLVWISLANIITSIFVEKALDFAQPGLEEQIMDKYTQDKQTALELRELLRTHDIDDSGTISYQEFRDCLKDKRLLDYLDFRGLDIKDTSAFFDMLLACSEHGEVDIRTIIGGCIKMKGLATSIDLLTLSCEMRHMFKMHGDWHQDLAERQQQIMEHLGMDIAPGMDFSVTPAAPVTPNSTMLL